MRKRVTEKLDYDKVLLMFKETKDLIDQSSQEFNRRLLELEKQFLETDRKFKETDRKFQETDKKFQETDRRFQETDKKIQETNKQLRMLLKKVSESETRWGKFVESLVEGTLLKLLNERGIAVQRMLMRAKGYYQNKEYEFDIIAKDGDTVVVVEVKTTLGIEDVKHFLRNIKIFKEIFSEYSTNKIIGAVAYISASKEAPKYAIKNGLFVIKATNESAVILNENDFVPKFW